MVILPYHTLYCTVLFSFRQSLYADTNRACRGVTVHRLLSKRLDTRIIVLYKTIMKVNAENFLYVLSKIRQRLFSFLEAEMATLDIENITPAYGDILYVLDRKGPLSMQDIARYTMKDKSTISTAINCLERNGYVVKAKNNDDRRVVTIMLTPKSKKMRPALFAISRAMNARLFNGLSDYEKDALFKLIGRVYRNV